MKHPSHTSRAPGRAREPAARDREPAARDLGAERPHDLLARELDDLRSELETLAAAEPPDGIDERAEAVRERYSELLDDYGDDPEALTRIRALGRRIKDLEEAGNLPRSLIRRGRSRR
jgi:hypothetical protein